MKPIFEVFFFFSLDLQKYKKCFKIVITLQLSEFRYCFSEAFIYIFIKVKHYYHEIINLVVSFFSFKSR